MSKVISIRLSNEHLKILGKLMETMKTTSYGDVIRQLITSAGNGDEEDWRVELWRLSGTPLHRISRLLGKCSSPEEFFSAISTRSFLVRPAIKRRGEVCLEFVISERPFVISIPLSGNLSGMIREIVLRLKYALERAFEEDLRSTTIERGE